MKVLNKQSLLDIAIQESGTAENWLEIAMKNNLVPTKKVKAGTNLTIPVFEQVDNEIVRFLKARKIQPATAISTEVATIIAPAPLSCLEEIENCFK